MESFCLVTPNWSVGLPGLPYDGDDPDGFDARDAVVARLERYAAPAPVHEGVDVRALRAAPGGGFALETSEGTLRARRVVVASGAYQRPHRVSSLPAGLAQVDVARYRSPGALPEGPILVIGSGQSGCQIAEELHAAGRDVVLSCGRAPWAPRRIDGRDLVWWLRESGFLDQPVGALPGPEARLLGNVLVTGHGGGRDMHLRTLRAAGITLAGHFLGADGRRVRFAPDLGESVAWGDERHGQLMELFRKAVGAVDVAEPEPFDARGAPEEIDLAGFGAAIVAGGFRPGYASWIEIPGAFGADGFPLHREGASTAADGLYFVGVHFLRKRKSALFIGVGEDAAIVAAQIARASATPPARAAARRGSS